MPERNNTPARLLNLVWVAVFLFCSFPLDVGCEAINQISHHPHHLYPFGDGSGDASLPPGDDTSSNRIRLNVPLPINQRAHEYIFVNINGLLSTGGPVSRHIPSVFPLSQVEQDWYGAVIAPYWSDVNTRLGGRVFWRQDQRAGMLKLVDDDIRQHFPSASDYAPTLIFVATWHRVRCFECPVHLVLQHILQANTFQAVLATDGRTSFVIFKYGRLQWRPHPDLVQAGFDAGDGSFFYEIDAVDLAVGMPGKWIFQLNVQTKTCTTTSDEPGSESEVLNQVELPIVSTTVCNDSIHYNGSITASMLCAGYDEGDKAPCHGDSGGPLLCVDSSGRWVVEGVTSWGDKCGMPNRPGVFANVSALYRFIVDTIIENDNK